MGTNQGRPSERAPTAGEKPGVERSGGTPRVRRWFCACQEPHVLLGTCDKAGRIHLKAGDRYWHVVGTVLAICPRCGCEYELNPQAERRASVVLIPETTKPSQD